MNLKRNDLTIADQRPDVSYVLDLKTLETRQVMGVEMKALYHMYVYRSPIDWIVPTLLNAELVTGTNVVLTDLEKNE